MAELTDELLLFVLRQLAERDPHPFYPADRPPTLDRDTLDRAFDLLRHRDIIELTEWTQGKGQGVRLTDYGRQALGDPRLLHRARPAVREIAPPENSSWERGEALRQGFTNPRHGMVVRALLFVNIACFVGALALAMSFGVSIPDFLLNGGTRAANDRLGTLSVYRVIQDGEWWRIVAYGFLHGGLLHIAFNMSALWSFGRLMENLWGSFRFTILYFFSLVAGGCMVLAVTDPHGVVGASGALFGLLPSLGVFTWLYREHLPDAWRYNVRQTLVMNGIIAVMISTMPGVSWTGHLGGALGGLVISFPLHWTRSPSRSVRLLAWLSIPLLFAALILGIYAEYHWTEMGQQRLNDLFRLLRQQ